ncbi:MAG: hypothetical protein LUF28_06425 [Clostridiales bacterium]|nr:hypothetical protein [Clostridiales bacterium]
MQNLNDYVRKQTPPRDNMRKNNGTNTGAAHLPRICSTFIAAIVKLLTAILIIAIGRILPMTAGLVVRADGPKPVIQN